MHIALVSTGLQPETGETTGDFQGNGNRFEAMHPKREVGICIAQEVLKARWIAVAT